MPASATLNVRELTHNDIPLIADYWLNASPEYLRSMGADAALLPPRQQFEAMLAAQLALPASKKRAYALIWELNGTPCGHCNVNGIEYGNHAYMHLHLWHNSTRQKGLGLQLVKLSVPFFFRTLELQTLYCEPYAQNPAPNRTLQRAGFVLERTYTTVPGSINFEQEVNRYALSRWSFERGGGT